MGYSNISFFTFKKVFTYNNIKNSVYESKWFRQIFMSYKQFRAISAITRLTDSDCTFDWQMFLFAMVNEKRLRRYLGTNWNLSCWNLHVQCQPCHFFEYTVICQKNQIKNCYIHQRYELFSSEKNKSGFHTV